MQPPGSGRADQVRDAVDGDAAIAPLRVAVNWAGIGIPARSVSHAGHHDFSEFARMLNCRHPLGTFTVLATAAAATASTEPTRTASAASLSTRPRSRRTTARLRTPRRRGCGRAYPFRWTRSLAAPFPGEHDRSRHRRHPDAGHGGRRGEGRSLSLRSVPQGLCSPDEFAKLVTMIADHDGARRRDDPNGRRPADGTAMTSSPVTVEVTDAVAHVRLNRRLV